TEPQQWQIPARDGYIDDLFHEPGGGKIEDGTRDNGASDAGGTRPIGLHASSNPAKRQTVDRRALFRIDMTLCAPTHRRSEMQRICRGQFWPPHSVARAPHSVAADLLRTLTIV